MTTNATTTATSAAAAASVVPAAAPVASATAATSAAPSTASAPAAGAASASPSPLSGLLEQMFGSMSLYMHSELTSTADEYALLAELNQTTARKYHTMSDKAQQLYTALTTLQATYASLKPYLDQIDELDENLGSLEAVVTELDAYSKRLSEQFKLLYR